MKGKKLFFWLLLLLLFLTGVCYFLLLEEKSFNSNKKEEMVAASLTRTLDEAQEHIDLLLIHEPFIFVEDNLSRDSSDTLSILLSILESLDGGEVALTVMVHSDGEKSRESNRKHSQKQADVLLANIDDFYHATYINAIGYGAEFPLYAQSNQIRGKRVEIYLQQLEESNFKN